LKCLLCGTPGPLSILLYISHAPRGMSKQHEWVTSPSSFSCFLSFGMLKRKEHPHLVSDAVKSFPVELLWILKIPTVHRMAFFPCSSNFSLPSSLEFSGCVSLQSSEWHMTKEN
jgi:hypothetical protein